MNLNDAHLTESDGRRLLYARLAQLDFGSGAHILTPELIITPSGHRHPPSLRTSSRTQCHAHTLHMVLLHTRQTVKA
ncbi:uncharacterized protein BJ212DRAFT_1378658 [Suillus subaureus]|uniref:Uncharacterized protein n=1 Tax=Suillus subaureus TaxID=48587 RepID=A0A9P7E2V1_9AGAM|nr:uncharacterized protein BJ212DRAFT_1378658 [Suillus subaureus]KAG1809632.1 hypothetical protein BJ212DRAFT_1378658 [Suillus subaureus]